MPSPRPGEALYTTEHGIVTIAYAPATQKATRVTLTFFEGKSPPDAMRLADAFLPPDATETGGRIAGSRLDIRVFASKRFGPQPIYVECGSARPSTLCEFVRITAGSP